MNKNILITGGLGYVGGRIAEFLSSNTDYNLIVADITDKVITPHDWIKKGNILNLDITSKNIADALKDINCIVHLAAVNEIESLENPEKALLINGFGSLNLLKMAELNKVERFIYFSTAHIYKSPLSGVIDEKTLPRPIHPYAITHKVAEDFILASYDKKKIQSVVIRMSNSFGKPVSADIDRWTLLVNDLCKQAVVNKKLILKSSGLQVRDFITLEDVSRAVHHLIQLPPTKLDNGIFNLGGEKTLSILDMTTLIADRCNIVLGFYPKIIRPEPVQDESIDYLEYRIDKLKNTGFNLLSNFEKEIDNMLIFCNESFK